jgi:hypothetical protein
MRARAPASSANLGPGFDVLAIALDRYVQVEVEPAAALSVHSEGEGAGLFDDASHLAARVAAEVLGHDRISVTVRSQIPVARGLGSSAALAAASRPLLPRPRPVRRGQRTRSPSRRRTRAIPRTRRPASSGDWWRPRRSTDGPNTPPCP